MTRGSGSGGRVQTVWSEQQSDSKSELRHTEEDMAACQASGGLDYVNSVETRCVGNSSVC